MAKLDMRKALASAVTPLDANVPAEESASNLRLVEAGPAAHPVADAVDETVLNTDVLQPGETPTETTPTDPEAVSTPAPPGPTTRQVTTVKPATRPDTAPASLATALGVDVEEQLDYRLVAYRASTRLSFHQIILDAVEHCYPMLSELVAKALGREEAAAPQVKLFERTFVPGPVALEGRQDRVTHTIRISATNRSMLDDITAKVKAPSRNFMICVALDNYLPA